MRWSKPIQGENQRLFCKIIRRNLKGLGNRDEEPEGSQGPRALWEQEMKAIEKEPAQLVVGCGLLGCARLDTTTHSGLELFHWSSAVSDGVVLCPKQCHPFESITMALYFPTNKIFLGACNTYCTGVRNVRNFARILVTPSWLVRIKTKHTFRPFY